MRLILFILILSVSRIFSQVGPPDLRCLEVLAGSPPAGVKLTWLQPADPTNSFYRYEIYHSNVLGGPFLMVGSVPSLTTTVFTDNTSISGYFYLLSKYNAGTNSSLNSDTVKTMSLNIISTSGAPDLKITYNNIHQPKLKSSATSYTISKEFPAGTWKTLGISPDLKYADTISVCNATLSYQVSLADNSGCISLSNIITGVYKDTKRPNEPYIDSISVLPNGNTVLAWRIPRDQDISVYEIQQLVGEQHPPIDTLNGRNNTIYTYTTTTANFTPVSIYVKALDSCNTGGSTVDYAPTTIFLQTNYNRCAYQTTLFWNEYTLRSSEVLEYRIYYSVNGGIFKRVGSTTQTSFVHDSVDGGKNICYFVRMVTKGEGVTSSSNRSCFFSSQVEAPAFIYLKSASIFDNNTAYIKVLLDNSKTSVGIDILRSDDGISFASVGFVPFDGGRDYFFKDDKIQAGAHSYFYKVTVRDSCGNSRVTGNTAKTVFLKVLEDKDEIFDRHLSWNSYLGFAGDVSGYNIYRIVNGDAEAGPVASTGPEITEYTDNLEIEARRGSKIEYLVQAVEGISNPYGILEKSASNLVPVYVEGRLFVPTAFAPGGENKTWLPITHFIDKYEYRVRVFNRWGKKVFETSSDSQSWDGANCPPDVYVYLITYKNARGEYQEVTGSVLLLR